MYCVRPIRASLDSSGSVVFSQRFAVSGLEPFTVPCRKCLPCRLSIAREKAVRAVHEAEMHDENIFLTLTYDDEHLLSPRLVYSDFQNFMKSLRKQLNSKITYMVTGEYGELNKRPHWHALIFGFRPKDAVFYRTSERGDPVFTSAFIDRLWKKGRHDFGDVTIDSANYVARYSAKKLVHGPDGHCYEPIHKTSSRRGIGRSWIEKHYKFVFSNGFIVLPNYSVTKIPRYYIDWYKRFHFTEYLEYCSTVRDDIIEKAKMAARKEELVFLSNRLSYSGGARFPDSRLRVKERILERKFNNLQEFLKL